MTITDDPLAVGFDVTTVGPVTRLALGTMVDAASPRVGREIGTGSATGTAGPVTGEIIRAMRRRGPGRTETAAKP